MIRGKYHILEIIKVVNFTGLIGTLYLLDGTPGRSGKETIAKDGRKRKMC